MPKTAQCLVDHATYDMVDGMTLRELDQQLQTAIHQAYPAATPTSFICSEHLVGYRMQKMDRMVAKDYQQNKKINHRLTQIMQKNTYQVVDVNRQLENSLTFGQRVADAVARFGGSWAFIISFVSVMLLWMLINVVQLFGMRFDPYPFILLNLFLSMVAAIQAPLIMMSQNRAAEYDRLQAVNDFRVNSKSEEEIRVLHTKVDHLIQQDEPNMLEIQKMQTQMLGEIQAQVNELRRLQARHH
ncbi:DUF1003 domain-containing protein [Lactiplantibacillus sp. WILCCON 0030]|uniref:DUF1003 domain-containing protein n=1 Tax=Lactiplantibacillus brownii TaxID=3069269 RepID=A0ABU1A8U3_9LACO|nr:DUF1003 domain-containing protein [Lactiplantibacillus brownii]MDQ7937373.1 DUF1003 domain-containing protein [Lactiplantibacillus brownii]